MKSRFSAVLLLLGVWLARPQPSAAQWVQTNGPEECPIRALAVDGSRVYAVVAGHGLFSSGDGGAHWRPVATGLPPDSELISVEATHGSVFAGTDGGLVLFSTDGGASWGRFAIDFRKGSVSKEVTCFALVGSDLFIGTREGLFSRPAQPDSREAPVLVLHQRDIASLDVMGTDLLARSDWEGALILRRNGKDWTPKELKIGKGEKIHCLEVSGTNLFAGVSNEIFLSSDGGSGWTQISSDLPEGASIACFAVDGSSLLAGLSYYHKEELAPPVGVRLSRTGGQGWKTVRLGLAHTTPRCLAMAGSNLLAGTSSGIWLSRDGGTTWRSANSGLPVASGVAGLEMIGGDLFARTQNGSWGSLHRSSDKGKTWQRIDLSLPPDADIACLAAVGPDLFVGNDIPYDMTGQGVYMSSDKGRTWVAIHSDPPLDSGVSYFAAIGRRIYAVMGDEVYLSNDNGASWTARSDRLPGGAIFSCLVALGDRLFVGLSTYVGFTPRKSVLPTATSLSLGSQALYAMGPTRINGLFVLDKGYDQWEDTRARFSRAITDLALVGKDLFLGTANGLYCCEDYRGSRKFVKLELTKHAADDKDEIRDIFHSNDVPVDALAAVGADLFVGTDKGVILVRKRAEGWTAVRMDMPENTRVLCFKRIGQDLFAGTARSGVWRFPIAR